ncbi:hypothetical protein ABFS83_08G233400 [Erythranthe nasuta]
MKMQIAFSVLVFLFIFAIDESTAGPQMCSKFDSCTVTINVCKTKCNQRHGRTSVGFCAKPGTSVDPSSPPSSPTIDGLDDLLQLAKEKPVGKCACHCKYKANKCPRAQKPPAC